MTYQPLARTYRPSTFLELVGQDATARALANAIRMGREAHSVIFTGVRGVGKTTVARLYAKALNCEQLQENSEPCNRCESCKAITAGCHEDVLEIDGASNTGVGDVRALQETIEYVPQRSKFKVYIIDEVHMLSTAAFNALLKTLEEPPPHVVFVFATTELHKVPQTIQSRCQSFYLKKLPATLIIKRLAEIFSLEGLKYDDKALAVIAREGHGSMRDALTLADQAIALGQGAVTTEVLHGMISNLSSSPYLGLLQSLVDRSFEQVAFAIAELDQGGVEFSKLIEELAGFARHAFIVQGIGINAIDTSLLGLDDIEIASLEKIAKTADSFDLNRIFRTLMKCREELDGSSLDRYVVENYLFEWCFDPGLPKIDDLLNRNQPTKRKDPGGNSIGQPSVSGSSSGSAVSGDQPRMSTGSMREMLAEMRQKQPAAGQQPQKKIEIETVKASAPARAVQGATVAPATLKPIEPSSIIQKPAVVSRFPESWRQLIDTWKREKPLQARKLEEVHAIHYSLEKITLAVPEEGLAGRQLLQKDEQVKITALFREIFDFSGVLSFIPRSQALLDAANLIDAQSISDAEAKSTAAVLSSDLADTADESHPTRDVLAPELLPETVRVENMRESDLIRQKKIDDSKTAPVTRDFIAAMNATIEGVRLPGHD